jgi:hypothetical protein
MILLLVNTHPTYIGQHLIPVIEIRIPAKLKMTAIRRKTGRRRNSQNEKFFVIVATVFFALYLIITSWNYYMISNHGEISANSNASTAFVPTLRGKKILIEVTTVGQFQYSYFENVLDNFRDLCETGAKVSLHITTSNCDPNPKEGDPDCPLYERSAENTLENNYSVEKIDQLNERLRCRDPDGSLDVSVRLISPDWGKQVVDNHRRVFYDHINDGFDVFVHSEEDETIRPTNILAFMDEMEKLRKLVGNEVSVCFPFYQKHQCLLAISRSISLPNFQFTFLHVRVAPA